MKDLVALKDSGITCLSLKLNRWGVEEHTFYMRPVWEGSWKAEMDFMASDFNVSVARAIPRKWPILNKEKSCYEKHWASFMECFHELFLYKPLHWIATLYKNCLVYLIDVFINEAHFIFCNCLYLYYFNLFQISKSQSV